MKKQFLISAIFSLVNVSAVADTKADQQITLATQHNFQAGPASNFSGAVEFARLPVMPSQGNVAPAIVTFEAGTISNWHTHKYGQYLIVTESEGRTQQWGKSIQRIAKGDVIYCPPNVKHWHGASEHRAMSHIAISPVGKDSVTWLEKVQLPQSAPASSASTMKSAPSPVTLSSQQLSILPIAAFSAQGDLEKLRSAIISGLNRGLTVNQLKEIFAHQYAYAGFPRALNGMLTLRDVLDQRAKQGIQDKQGDVATDLPSGTHYYQLGSETLGMLQNRSSNEAQKPLFNNFSPTMDYALKAHLFGYLFSRDNLAPLDRELVVLGTLSALEGTNSQLTSHLRITQNLGVNDAQMQRIIQTLADQVDPALADNAKHVYQQMQNNQ